MIDIIRTMCVVSCFMSGIYSFAMYFYFSKSKSTFWFGFICITLGLSISFATLCGDFYYSSVPDGLIGVFYLLSGSFLAASINMYAGFTISEKPASNLNIYSVICLLLALIGFIVPPSLYGLAYEIVVASGLISCIHGIYLYIRMRNKPGSFLFLILAVISLTVNRIIGLIPFEISTFFVALRLFSVLLFVIFSLLYISQNYRTSINRTKALSTSLIDTIASINHSDNALMCTQMKADFLYQSLDLISQKCDEDPWDAEELTIYLSKYLRHTLNFQQLKGIVPISNEIELTKSYIAIERERYPFITFEYNFPNPMPEFHIPPLSIQPLVENAIEHAFINKKDKARISISILEFRDYYHIDISDNGDGMDEDFAETLTDSLHETARIGIYNIHTRLINLFGKGIVVQSALGVGTSVSFVVPPNAVEFLAKEDEQK